MAGEYNIIFDEGDHCYSELVNDFVTRLKKEAEKWGFTCIENNPGMSYFDQLDDMKKTSKVTIVILLPNHDDRRAMIQHQAQTTLRNAIEQTVPMIPICLENANPTHFKMYNKIEFKTAEDWGHSESWTKLLKALQKSCDKNQGGDKTTLDEACSKHGRTSPEIKAECKRICEGFKRQVGVKDAWPAYVYAKGGTESEERITFIVITERNNINFDDQGYRCVLRQNDTISDACKAENADISEAEMEAMKKTEQKDDSSDCFDGIMLKIEEEIHELMSKHKNINRITASRVKSTGYRCGKESIKEQICIALYVHVKGFIPLDENHFPNRIGDYPVDIREGIVNLGLSCHGKK